MQKDPNKVKALEAAIAQIDKPEEATAETEEAADEKKEKKSLFGKKKED